jgi:hypothetical protein
LQRAALIFAMTAALAGCESQSPPTRDGADRIIVIRSGSQGGTTSNDGLDRDVAPMPSDLPRWAPAFPGAKVAQVVVQGTAPAALKSVVLATRNDMKTVVSFYDAKIAAAGMRPAMVQDTADGAVRMVESPVGARDMLMIGRSENATSISVSYSTAR